MEAAHARRKKRKRFHQLKHKAVVSGNPEEIIKLLKQYDYKGTGYFCWAKSLYYNEDVCPYLTPKTVIRAINNGHTDIDIQLYVNPQKKETVWTKGYKFPKTVCHSNANFNGFVLDLDNSPFMSIKAVEAYVKKMDCPMPWAIIHTSRSGFHLVYKDGKFGGKLMKSDRFCVAAKLVGLDYVPADRKEFEESLNKIGIEYGYLKKDPASANFRVPGSINSKYMNPFIIKGKIYEDYDVDAVSAVGNSISKTPFNFLKKEKVANNYWYRHIPMLQIMCKKYLGNLPADVFGKWLASNLTLLKKGRCNIPQVHVSDKVQVSQSYFSKVLRRMIRDGILVKTGAHSHSAGIAAMYGFTEQTLNKLGLGKSSIDLANYNLTEEYKTGDTHHRMLSDIRFMHQAGIDTNEIVDVIEVKMISRPMVKRRSYKEIRYFVDRWIPKAWPKRYKEPPPEIREVLDEIRGESSA